MTKKYTCEEALELLRIKNGKHDPTLSIREELIAKRDKNPDKPGQWPYAAILACADSRVVPELIFGAKPGELFVVTVAGNIANTESIASLEYAIAILNVPVIIVLGHQYCGAVSAAIDYAENRKDLGKNLNTLVTHIIPVINDPVNDDLDKAIKDNAIFSANQLIDQSDILRKFHDNKDLLICSAHYQIYEPEAGSVQMLGDCFCGYPKPA